MIRFLYTLCDIIAGICAVVSPIAIFHWLLKAMNIAALKVIVDPLSGFFNPFNSLLDFFIDAPVIKYQGHSVSTIQGVFAILLTIAFFVFHFIAETLKATEQRVEVNTQVHQQRRRLQQLKAEQQRMHTTVRETRRIYAQINYDFASNPTGGAYFESGYQKYGGRAVEIGQRGMSLEFGSLEQAFKYSLEAAQQIMSYYATLRPIDPQPPYQVAIHAVEQSRQPQEALTKTRQLSRYAAGNQIVFSQEVKSLMDANGVTMKYQFQSLGMYAFDGGRNQEVYRLLNQRRDRVF